MFENFPYTDMHQLNLDWIIKIAKDFLDQYTHIQQLIADGEESLQNLTEEGLQQLQDKADNLETLLQEWYNTHSQDIANQLADALNDLNEWYTLHQNYLDATLTEKIALFNSQADQKAAQTIATIPDDYTTLSNNVLKLLGLISPLSITWESGAVSNTTGNTYWATNAIRTGFIQKPGEALTLFYVNPNKRQLDIYLYDVNSTFISHYDCGKHESGILYLTANTVYCKLVMTDSNTITTSYADGFFACSGLEEINNNVFKAVKVSNTMIPSGQFTGNYSDMDTFPINEIILISGATSNTLAHCPTSPFTGYVLTINYHGNQLILNRDFSIQIAINLFDNVNPGINNIYYRSKYSSWSDWKTVNQQFFESGKGLKNFTVLGDSISQSLSYPTAQTGIVVESWASIMAKDMHRTASIYAYGGITTGGMLTNQNYPTAVANAGGNQYAIIFLGINDANDGIALNTFENNYRQLISDMLLHHKFVFCVTIPAGLKNNTRLDYNEIIENICANTNKAFALDLNSYSEYTGLLAYNGHMSSTGYAVIANMIEKLIDKTVTTDAYFIHGTLDQ